LKQFNPNVIGFSVGDFNEKGFNFARSTSESDSLEQQALDLLSAMETDKRIDMNSYWKLVFLSVGSADLCHNSCKNPGKFRQVRRNVEAALDVLMKIPNIVIGVVSPPDPSIIQSALHRPVTCQVLTRSLCPCVTSNAAKSRSEFLVDLQSVRSNLRSVVQNYQSTMNSGVVFLSGLEELSLPADKGLNLQVLGLPSVSLLPDLSYLAPNCFHPSQKLHSKMAKMIWNNLFHIGQDSSHLWDKNDFWCPSRDDPNFFGTRSRSTFKSQRMKRQSSKICSL